MKIYIGNYIEVLETFHKLTGVDLAISEKRNVDERIVQYCLEHSITLIRVASVDDLHVSLNRVNSVDLCIVASFGLLLREEFIQKAGTIVNIHPGSLMNSRGRHPLPFAIKQNLPYMTLTAHLIEDEKIDNGPVVAEWNIPISYSESYSENDIRLRSILPALTEYILKQYLTTRAIQIVDIDLLAAPYNNRLTAEELDEMIQAENLMKYRYS